LVFIARLNYIKLYCWDWKRWSK